MFDNKMVRYSLFGLKSDGLSSEGNSKPKYVPFNLMLYKYQNGVTYLHTNTIISEFQSPKCEI